MTTEEGNKIIAKFMGWDEETLLLPYITGGKGTCRQSEFKYHSSWDWLIPAYSKFHKEVLHEIFQNKRTELSGQFAIWEHNFQAAVDVNSVSNAFDILVLALQWYNQNKEK